MPIRKALQKIAQCQSRRRSHNTLFEIGNNAGDHAVVEVGRGRSGEMRDLLQSMGVSEAIDPPFHAPAERVQQWHDQQDPRQLSYREAPVYQGDEDREQDLADYEDDADREPDNEDCSDAADRPQFLRRSWW